MAKNNQDLMVAGNAIERSHKNIFEIANFMLSELHFPYVIFLEGSNFLTENISIERPDGRIVVLNYDSGALNRLDRLSSANYGMPFNTNLCVNKFVKHRDRTIMLQAASIYNIQQVMEVDGNPRKFLILCWKFQKHRFKC